MTDVQTKFPHPKHGMPCQVVYVDKRGVTHFAVGSRVNLARDDFLLLWTACGRMDVPANGAWLKRPEDHVECLDCNQKIVHIHRGGGRDADDCGLCHLDIRNPIHESVRQ